MFDWLLGKDSVAAADSMGEGLSKLGTAGSDLAATLNRFMNMVPVLMFVLIGLVLIICMTSLVKAKIENPRQSGLKMGLILQRMDNIESAIRDGFEERARMGLF